MRLGVLSRVRYPAVMNFKKLISKLHYLFSSEVLINLVLATIGSVLTFRALFLFITWDCAWKRPVTTITILVLSALTLSFSPVDKR